MTNHGRFTQYSSAAAGGSGEGPSLAQVMKALYGLLRKHPEIQEEFEEVLLAMGARYGDGGAISRGGPSGGGDERGGVCEGGVGIRSG